MSQWMIIDQPFVQLATAKAIVEREMEEIIAVPRHNRGSLRIHETELL